MLRQTVHTNRATVHQEAKLVAALIRVAWVTAGLAESNGSLPPGLWLTSLKGWLPRTGINSGTLRSVIEYALPLPLMLTIIFYLLKFRLMSHRCQQTLNWTIHISRERECLSLSPRLAEEQLNIVLYYLTAAACFCALINTEKVDALFGRHELCKYLKSTFHYRLIVNFWKVNCCIINRCQPYY